MVPILGNYVADGEHAIKAGFAGLDAAGKAIEALEPNADLWGLKGKVLLYPVLRMSGFRQQVKR